jgi:squalene cyclase
MRRKVIFVLSLIILMYLSLFLPLIMQSSQNRNRITNSIKIAVSYLTQLQNDSGLFCDFLPLNSSDGYTHVYSHEYILDALIDAYLTGYCNQDIITKGINWLISQQSDNGLWKFRNLVPTDSDESGIAAVALMTYNNKTSLVRTMEDFSEYQAESGIFPLWLNETLSGFNQTYDLDQTSVVLYSMFLFNSTKYATNLSRGVGYVRTNQSSEGYWNCTYYYGPFYGTFISTRLLAAYGNSSNQLQQSYQFLLNSQNTDGGWGRDLSSNPLDTAFAILALTYLRKIGFDITPSTNNGINYLIGSQFSNGTWAIVPFWGPMYPPYNIYQSHAMTTLFALKALVRTISPDL